MSKIRLGNHYRVKYLDGISFISTKIKPKKGHNETYIITGKPNGPWFKGTLSILEDGRAVMHVKYTSYGGRLNDYRIWFNKEGFEIIHYFDSTREEKKYFNSLA